MASEVLTGAWAPRYTLRQLWKIEASGKNVRCPFPAILPGKLRGHFLSGFEEDLTKRSKWQELIDAFKSLA